MMCSKLFEIRLAATFLILLFAANFVKAQENRQLTQESETQKRTALVIGNGDYLNARTLANPVNDAEDVTKALAALGFEVISGTNLNLKLMNDKVREFGDKLKINGGVGLFYYAGHGIQVGGKNFLIPVEADIPREDEVDFNALNLDLVLRKMATANNGLNIVILDACRNNPFARSWSRGADEGGLAQITAPTGTFIAYATSPDRTASDGTGRNGLYTAELLKILNAPNLKIEEAFKQVTIAVDRASGGKQVPWTSSSLRGEFYFKMDGLLPKTPPVVVSAPQVKEAEKTNNTPTSNNVTAELEAWNRIKDSRNVEDYAKFLNQYPNGIFANQAKAKLIQAYGGSDENDSSNPYQDIFKANADMKVFLLDGENRTQLKIATNKQDYNIRGGAFGIGGGVKQVINLNGSRALLRTKTNPVFEYSASSNINVSDVVFVVKLKSKSDQREIQIGQKTFNGFKKEDIVPVAFEEVAGTSGAKTKVYKIKFPSALAPGEYAIVVKEPYGKELGIYTDNSMMPGVFFDFGIDAGK